MRILVLPGDGIGPEITAATMAIMNRLNDTMDLGLEFTTEDIGFVALEKHGSTFPDALARIFPTFNGVILGPNDAASYPPREQGGINYSGYTRTRFDLYANYRPARTPPGLPAPLGEMDLVIMRELTEGHYADRNMHQGIGEMMPTPDMAISIRKITRHASERIARRAFELAMTRRKYVTIVHKANVLKMGDGLFLDAARTVAREFPEVRVDDLLVDAMCAHLVRTPDRFDVIVTENLYGDLLSDLASELSGSLGLSGSIMAGDTLCAAQAQHGAAPDIAGQDRANPTSLMLSAAMLLEWLAPRHGRPDLATAGAAIRDAVYAVIARPELRTPDLGGPLGTAAFGAAAVDALG